MNTNKTNENGPEARSKTKNEHGSKIHLKLKNEHGSKIHLKLPGSNGVFTGDNCFMAVGGV